VAGQAQFLLSPGIGRYDWLVSIPDNRLKRLQACMEMKRV
jgi:hypothetical protein